MRHWTIIFYDLWSPIDCRNYNSFMSCLQGHCCPLQSRVLLPVKPRGAGTDRMCHLQGHFLHCHKILLLYSAGRAMVNKSGFITLFSLHYILYSSCATRASAIKNILLFGKNREGSHSTASALDGKSTCQVIDLVPEALSILKYL